MISVVVNLSDNSEMTYDNLSRGSVSEVIEAIKLIHPTWTSIVLTLSNTARG